MFHIFYEWMVVFMIIVKLPYISLLLMQKGSKLEETYGKILFEMI